MAAPLYEARFVSDGARHVVGALGALGLVGLVGAGLLAFQGLASREPAIVGACIAAGAVLVVLAWIAQRRAARRVVLERAAHEGGGVARLRVLGATGVELEVEGPFDVSAAWTIGEVATGRGGTIRHPVLMLVVRKAGTPALLLEESLGAIHQPPAGWREGVVDARGARRLVNSIGRVHLDRLRSLLIANG